MQKEGRENNKPALLKRILLSLMLFAYGSICIWFWWFYLNASFSEPFFLAIIGFFCIISGLIMLAKGNTSAGSRIKRYPVSQLL